MSTLYAYYDLGIGPVSFDFVPFLIQSVLAQRAAGCKRLHIVIVPDENGVEGMFRDKRHLYDAHEMRWRLWNIVVPATRMANASVTLATHWPQARRLPGPNDVCWPEDWDRQALERKHYLIKDTILAAKAGIQVPMLEPLEHAKRAVRERIARAGKPLITLTMRNTYEPSRNADVSLWTRTVYALRERFLVVQVCDTADELVSGGYGGLNLELRAALYAEARQNLHCHGGPVVLNWFMDAPFVMFGAARPHGTWKQNWIDNVALQIGEQLPWARPDQRIRYDEIDQPAMDEEIGRLCTGLVVA